ncbi:MAG: hypothetical protein ACQUHE_17355, partial [Bacteroidia bacterium]
MEPSFTHPLRELPSHQQDLGKHTPTFLEVDKLWLAKSSKPRKQIKLTGRCDQSDFKPNNKENKI